MIISEPLLLELTQIAIAFLCHEHLILGRFARFNAKPLCQFNIIVIVDLLTEFNIE